MCCFFHWSPCAALSTGMLLLHYGSLQLPISASSLFLILSFCISLNLLHTASRKFSHILSKHSYSLLHLTLSLSYLLFDVCFTIISSFLPMRLLTFTSRYLFYNTKPIFTQAPRNFSLFNFFLAISPSFYPLFFTFLL